MRNSLIAAVVAVFLFVPVVNAQQAEVTITLNEQFFDSLLDSMFEHGAAPEFPISASSTVRRNENAAFLRAADHPYCPETIKLLRENQAVRTAVRFREGRVYVPIAFSGSYNPPLIGCIDFAGYAESNIDLEFDRASRTLIGRVRVLNVVLNGTAGIGSSVVTKMVQSSIDKKLNPIEIVKADKLSFIVPVQGTSVRMESNGIRSEVANGSLLIHVDYTFPK